MNRVVENRMPMLIVQVEPPQKTEGGDYFYRTHAPGIAMSQEENIFVVNATNVHRRKDHIMREADVLVLKNICDPDILPLIRERKLQKRLTVYEMADDLNALQPWNPVYLFYKNKENLALVYRLASCCDAMQVTVPELKRLYGHLNKRCEVFPNQILHVPPERVLKESDAVVIGWGGSHGHLEDMAEIAAPLINWINSQTNVVLDLMCSDPIWRLFDSLSEDKKRRTLPGSIEDYYNFLAKIDIGIAPLKDTAFNRSRSDVKCLEYAVSGVVPVLANLEPYLCSIHAGENGFLFKDTNELIDILNRLAKNAPLLPKVSKAARHYVMRERLQLEHGRERIDFYRNQLRQVQRDDETIERGRDRFEKWSGLEGAVINGRHLRLPDTRFENLLHDGLVTMQITGDKKHARQLFEEASAIEQDNYLPFLFGSPVSPDAISCLQKALELNPDSIKAWLLLGETFTRRGKVIDAINSFESAVKIYPDYEIPYLRAADLLKKTGELSQAEKLFDRARELEIT